MIIFEKSRFTNLKAKIVEKIVSWVLPDVRKLIPEETSLIKPSPNSPKGMRGPEVVAISGHL